MYIIGVTGGIGSGKSTATEYLRAKGFGYIDADQIARNLTAEGQPLLEVISREFGCVETTGTAGNGLVLDRKALADLVFNNQGIKEKFDSIVHREIINVIDAEIQKYREQSAEEIFDGHVILDAPLLFESGINEKCDFVILVTCDMDERIRRVSLRDGTTAEKIQDRIRNQLDDQHKIKLSDYVIDNSGNREELFRQLDNILETLELS